MNGIRHLIGKRPPRAAPGASDAERHQPASAWRHQGELHSRCAEPDAMLQR
ncbi:hypothetical protein L810_6672 [Burkholderia sp. AU4i]|nr:hypothetical protein L810_6672 [Burkholderia sp. AU4i]